MPNTHATYSWDAWYAKAIDSLPVFASAGDAMKIRDGLKKLLLDERIVTSVSDMND